jgi:hypothetical protein
MGSRYGGLKQLDPVGPSGEIILDYSVRDALAAGFGKVIFVIRRDMADLFRETVGCRYEDITEVAYAFQELDPLPGGRTSPSGRTKPWGTAHAVLCAAGIVREPFAVINADDYYGPSGFRSMSVFLSGSSPRSYAMIGYRLDQTLSEHGSVSRGICRVGGDGRLLSIEERTAIARDADGRIIAEGHPPLILSGEELISMNFWGFTPDLFEGLERLFGEFLDEKGSDPKAECYLPAAVGSLIKSGEVTVTVLPSSDAWIGLTYPEDRSAVVAALAALPEEPTSP